MLGTFRYEVVAEMLGAFRYEAATEMLEAFRYVWFAWRCGVIC